LVLENLVLVPAEAGFLVGHAGQGVAVFAHRLANGRKMMSLRFFNPNWSNWQKAMLAALTASSMVSKMPMSRSGAGEEPDDADAVPMRRVPSGRRRCVAR
jgi:hypothetical protein